MTNENRLCRVDVQILTHVSEKRALSTFRMYPQDGGISSFRSVSTYLPNYTLSNPKDRNLNYNSRSRMAVP